ncbi:Solitary outer membrane autotransporter beta-barrel domain [Vibrio sp. VB16]|uniref:Solitary outer membrane autotransporter beta-barrel domain n=1 Tax=Vibrio sp. VB16 TaxID=2785746 RepID=UPI0018A008BF|nr:Solitary outer membrane autotransporter beta-barrel domain [Vibrio sp. VB16]UGA57106.1 Solitary outer membrane autotransporter beta-barrel domain [Vibrio sp. VB16]
MSTFKSIIICVNLCACLSSYSWANALQRNLEHTFAASVVLTDSDAFTFGISDFNPNNILNLDNEDIGSADSIDLRQRISVLTVPFGKSWESSENDYHSVNFKLSFLKVEQEVDFSTIFPSAKSDTFKEKVYGGYVGYNYHDQLTENWFLRYGIGGHLLYYTNSYDYNNNISRAYSNSLDGVAYNTDAWAFLLEPSFKIGYRKEVDWGNWQLSSRLNYASGRGWGEANNGDIGKPENARWINQVEIYHDFSEWSGMVQSIFASFKRVDLNGDSTEPLGTSYYYEVMGGWLITPPFETTLIDNVGIGLSLNYGSALKGGSIVLYFNQD